MVEEVSYREHSDPAAENYQRYFVPEAVGQLLRTAGFQDVDERVGPGPLLDTQADVHLRCEGGPGGAS